MGQSGFLSTGIIVKFMLSISKSSIFLVRVSPKPTMSLMVSMTWSEANREGVTPRTGKLETSFGVSGSKQRRHGVFPGIIVII